MRQCVICKKGTRMVGKLKKLRGKYNPTIKRRKSPNLQWVRPSFNVKTKDGATIQKGKRIKICAKCIKALSRTGKFLD